jgi:hypothetical protein
MWSDPDLFALSSDAFEGKIVEILARRCSEPLKLVRSVASQFRATPAKLAEPQASHFVITILRPIHQVLDSRPLLRSRYGASWSTRVVSQVLVEYAGILASVRKTEDLLRRHRRSKKNTFSLFGSSTTSASPDLENEEERFRRQMVADIEAFATDAQGLGVDVSAVEGWKELRDVVNRQADKFHVV